MARWEEVLDTQLAVHNWMQARQGQTFAMGYFQSAYESLTPGEGGDWKSVDEARVAGRNWAQNVAVAAFNAEPIYVDPDMMTVCEAAVRGFEPEPLADTDLITPMGFLVLPHSMWLVDPSGNRLSWRAALWWPSGSRGKMPDQPGRGIDVVLFHDNHEPDDMDALGTEFEVYLRESGYRWTTTLVPTHVVRWGFGEMHPGDADEVDVRLADNPDQPVFPDVDGDMVRSIVKKSQRGESAHRQLQGMWRLLMQHLAVPSKERPPRQAWKRAKAAKLPHERVTIVRLRRPPQDKEPGEPATVAWTHRWVVGGHWRNQWYASVGQHRQIWISPFVKGPEELPLVVNKARIFELVR